MGRRMKRVARVAQVVLPALAAAAAGAAAGHYHAQRNQQAAARKRYVDAMADEDMDGRGIRGGKIKIGPKGRKFFKNLLRVGGPALIAATAGYLAFKNRVPIVQNAQAFKHKVLSAYKAHGGRALPAPDRAVDDAIEGFEMLMPGVSGMSYTADRVDNPLVDDPRTSIAWDPEADHLMEDALETGGDDEIEGTGLSARQRREHKKRQAIKMEAMNIASHLIHKHLGEHLQPPHTGGPLLAQLKRLPEAQKKHAAMIGGGLLRAKGLGKRGKRIFSTLAKLGAVAAAAGALYHNRDRIKTAYDNTLGQAGLPSRESIGEAATNLFLDARGAAHRARMRVANALPAGVVADAIRPSYAARLGHSVSRASAAVRAGANRAARRIASAVDF